MVSETIVMAGTIAFFVLFMGPVLWFTWMSYGEDRHSPSVGEDDDEADAA